MSRPLVPVITNPTYSVRTWATDAAYPAGGQPWSSQPNKSEPSGPALGFVPDAIVLAQEVNKLLSDGFLSQDAAKAYLTAHVGETQAAINGFYAYAGQIPGMNWLPNFTSNVELLKFRRSTWFGIGSGNDHFFRSTTIGFAGSSSEIIGGNLSTKVHADFDVDTLGNIVLLDNASDTLKSYNGSAWSKVTGAFGGALTRPNVVYDPVRQQWAVAGVGATLQCYTSTNRTTWSAVTKPSGMGSPPVSLAVAPLTAANPGRIVMAAFAGTDMQFSYSDDGGSSWSAAQTLALGFTSSVGGGLHWPKPVFNGSYWLLNVISGATTSKVFRSDDGSSWSEVASLTATNLRWIAAIGEIWIGLTGSAAGQIVISTDQGVTWRKTDVTLAGSTIAASPSRFIVCGGGQPATPSFAVGFPADLAT